MRIKTIISLCFLPFVISLIVFLSRFSMIGSHPCTDEGYYAYYSMLFNSFSKNKDLVFSSLYFESINLYPFLCSFVFEFKTNPFLLLRSIDLIFSCFAFIILYYICKNITSKKYISLLIILPFIYILNNPKYIQAGFKNSINISVCFIYIGVYIHLINKQNRKNLYILSGFCLGFSTLLREFHLVYTLLLIFVFFKNNYLNFKLIIAGFTLSFVIVLIIMQIFTDYDFILNIIKSYFSMANYYHKVSSIDLFDSVLFSIKKVGYDFVSLILLFIPIILNLKTIKYNQKTILLLIIFITILFIEPFVKLCMPYHIATLFFITPIFIAKLVSINSSNKVCHRGFKEIFIIYSLIFYNIFLIYHSIPGYINRLGNKTISNIKPLMSGSWDEEFASKSQYILISKIIKENSKKGDTLAISSTAHVLFPLTGLFPNSPSLVDLYRTSIILGMPILKDALTKNPPDLIYLSERDPAIYNKLNNIINTIGAYDLVSEHPINQSLHYGKFAAKIYKFRN